MKIDRRRKALFAISVFSILSVAAALEKTASPSEILEAERDALANLQVDAPVAQAAQIGTAKAPADGKNGIPRDGPFVETNAERERKKTKEKDTDDPETLDTYKEGLPNQPIPESNNGVMDDRARKAPADGTRGTEGGVSEKSTVKPNTLGSDDKSAAKKPAAPERVPELPHSEKEKIKEDTGGSIANPTPATSEDKEKGKEKEREKKKLEKPTGLPEKPHSIPYPENPSSPKDKSINNLDQIQTPKNGKSTLTEPDVGVIQPLHSLLLSFTMILFSEIGDKTFLVACLMAMRHDRILVFTAAFSALITMTVLSAVLGHAVPTLIPKHITNFLAAALFLIFGAKMLLDARKISPDEGVSEEMKEVEMELEEKEQSARRMGRRTTNADMSPNSLYILESGRNQGSPTSSSSSSRSNSPTRRSRLQTTMAGVNNLFSLLLSPAWVQTFVMTFLGEWGDRSQIATIAMAAGQDYWWVTGGALIGHALCTGVAVIGGKAIAGRVSLRTVTMGGAIAFLVFGVIYLLEAVY